MIIFGASGDLTKRKLMPALYSLYRDKRLTGSFTVLGIGRTVYSDEDYRSYILGELQQFVKAEEQNLELMSSFVSHLYYLPMDPAKVEGYSQLRERLVELTKEVDPDNLLFYLATPPSLYGVVPLHLKAAGLNTPHSRIIVEKPFGYDLESALELNKIYSKYYDEVVLLLETGLRISEFCGLTTHIDMQNRILNIDHQLLKDSEMGYYIETPKTKNGKRELPLTERAYQAIQRILKNRGKAQPLIVGGYSNFLFLNREGLPKVAGNYEGMVRGLIKKYNKYHTDKLPNITPHSFRHTYCTNMANRGMNPNTLQYLMGHANITMTLGYYAHGTFQSAKAELERLAC